MEVADFLPLLQVISLLGCLYSTRIPPNKKYLKIFFAITILFALADDDIFAAEDNETDSSDDSSTADYSPNSKKVSPLHRM